MPSVDFARRLPVASDPSRVWDALTDVERLAAWITVVGDVREVSRLDSYTAVLADRLGPFRLSADLDINVVDVEEGSSIRFVAEGEDRQVASRITIDGQLSLTTEGSMTVIDVSGRYEVTGRVATLGASMIRSKGETILDQFVEAVERELA